ncbi:MAG: Ribonuclease HII [uncultured bacterium]|nr:MAG: Ribonuclease HII [uncultured bacterium]
MELIAFSFYRRDNDRMRLIAGVDEVGRGPLAGPVMAAAVILDSINPIAGLADSKLLTAKRREVLCEIIQNNCIAWAIGRAEVEEIDSINILQASLLAMQRAICALSVKPHHIQVDGNFCPKVNYSVEAIINGDNLVPVISAASIVAKVIRDREMVEYDKIYPQYGFAAHKGYGTKQHLSALRTFGVTPIHRRSFAPVGRIKKFFSL